MKTLKDLLFIIKTTRLLNFDGRGRVLSHRHPRGGGWTAYSAQVADTAFVGKHACVFGHAKVSGFATIEGEAVVYGRAQVTDHAVIGGDTTLNTGVYDTDSHPPEAPLVLSQETDAIQIRPKRPLPVDPAVFNAEKKDCWI